jgi:hypothetical protein
MTVGTLRQREIAQGVRTEVLLALPPRPLITAVTDHAEPCGALLRMCLMESREQTLRVCS